MRTQTPQNEFKSESTRRTLSNDIGRMRPTKNLRAFLRLIGAAILRAQKRVRRMLRGNIQATVRDVSPPRNGQAQKRVENVVTPLVHGLHIVGRVRVRAHKRGRNNVVVKSLPEKFTTRFERAHGHCED